MSVSKDRLSAAVNAAVSQNFPKLPTFSAAPAPEPLSNLNERQKTAINLLLQGATDTAVAKALSVDRRTIYTWRVTNADFRAELEQRRNALFDNATDQLRCMLKDSLDTLSKQLKDAYNPTSHRAARTVLSISRIGKWIKTPEPKPASATT
jgi:delta 1-pyrroline-5-carboxylate dehydrogenase